jgi:hypothetical protein
MKTNAGEGVEKKEPSTIAMSMCTGTDNLKNSLTFSLKIKHNFTIYPSIPFLGIYSREMKTDLHKDMHTNVHYSLNRETTQVSDDWSWINKM